MAQVEVHIAGRRYAVSCRDGEEPHLRTVAAIVDAKASEAATALGSLGEARHLLFASLLLADELKELREGSAAAPVQPDAPAGTGDQEVAEALERLAGQLESLAASLEPGDAKA